MKFQEDKTYITVEHKMLKTSDILFWITALRNNTNYGIKFILFDKRISKSV